MRSNGTSSGGTDTRCGGAVISASLNEMKKLATAVATTDRVADRICDSLTALAALANARATSQRLAAIGTFSVVNVRDADTTCSADEVE